MIEEILLETSRLLNNYHSIPVNGTVFPRLGFEVDEEIIIKGSNMSQKYYVDEEIILEVPDLPLKTIVLKVLATASSAVPYSSQPKKVSLRLC